MNLLTGSVVNFAQLLVLSGCAGYTGYAIGRIDIETKAAQDMRRLTDVRIDEIKRHSLDELDQIKQLRDLKTNLDQCLQKLQEQQDVSLNLSECCVPTKKVTKR